MPFAQVMLRQDAHYRRTVFEEGFRAAGFTLRERVESPAPTDVVCIWNRYGRFDAEARRFERAGATAIIVENGYLEVPGGPMYAIAIGQHNGAGLWHIGGAERWDGWGVPLAPWRTKGEHLLVLPQRGIGPPGVAMPRTWALRIVRELQKRTRRPVVVREHPGRHASRETLEQALAGAWAAVTWGSGAALKALAFGVPVFNAWDSWIGAPASMPLSRHLEQPLMDDNARLGMFRRLAWATWRIEEIRSGDAFGHLLRRPRGYSVPAQEVQDIVSRRFEPHEIVRLG